MNWILAISLLILSLIFLVWVVCSFYFNDFHVSIKSVEGYKNILVIFPHPDDEIFSAGGVMALNKRATLLILTKGERGTEDAHLDPKLKEIRSQEEIKSAGILRVKKLIHKDYGDLGLDQKKEEIRQEISQVINAEKPDLIITFDPSGFDGHPDHIAVSQVVTDLIKRDFKNVPLWYTTIPKRTYDFLNPSVNLAKDKSFSKKRTFPTHKVFVGWNVIRKMTASRAQHSQYKPFMEGLPIPIPVGFVQSLTLFEYFYKVN